VFRRRCNGDCASALADPAANTPPLGVEHFDCVYRKYRDRVYRTVDRLVAGRGFPEALTEDTCAQVWIEFLALLEQRQVKAAWPHISRVLSDHARWRAYDALRAESRRGARRAQLARLSAGGCDTGPSGWMGASVVWQMIEELPGNQQEVLLLVVDGLDSREIADVFGITVEAARQRVHRARVALGAALAQRDVRHTRVGRSG